MLPGISITLLYMLGMAFAQDDDLKGEDGFYYFVTRPDILAPKWDITVFDHEALAPGHWFVSPYEDLYQKNYPLWNGPMIYDTSGSLIWSGAPFVKYCNTFDFRVSRVDGRDMLTLIWPKNSPEQEAGFLIDDTYVLYKLLDMRADQARPNMHDLHLIEDGKLALMLTTPRQQPSHVVVPGEFEGMCKVDWQGFKEVDVATGKIVFEWNSRGILGVDETTYFPGNGTEKYDTMCSSYWDITHFNAIDKFEDGDYLLSSRHMDTIYKVSHKDNSIVWRLGGVKSDFVVKDVRATFSRQHHARIHVENSTHILVSLFDNALGDYPIKASSFESWGLLLALRIDTTPMTVELVSRFQKPFYVYDNLVEKARGSLSFLPNGNAFVGWPTGSQVAEYAPDGRMLMHAVFTRREAASYRAYKFPWIGRPSQPPDVAAAVSEKADGHLRTEIFVSWNGDTETATWNLLRTNAAGNASELVSTSPRQGFETRLTVDGIIKQLVVVAIDGVENEIGRSRIVLVDLPQRFAHIAAAEELEWLQSHPSIWQPPSIETNRDLIMANWFMIAAVLGGAAVFAIGVIRFQKRHRSLHRRQPGYELMKDYEEEIGELDGMIGHEDPIVDTEKTNRH